MERLIKKHTMGNMEFSVLEDKTIMNSKNDSKVIIDKDKFKSSSKKLLKENNILKTFLIKEMTMKHLKHKTNNSEELDKKKKRDSKTIDSFPIKNIVANSEKNLINIKSNNSEINKRSFNVKSNSNNDLVSAISNDLNFKKITESVSNKQKSSKKSLYHPSSQIKNNNLVINNSSLNLSKNNFSSVNNSNSNQNSQTEIINYPNGGLDISSNIYNQIFNLSNSREINLVRKSKMSSKFYENLKLSQSSIHSNIFSEDSNKYKSVNHFSIKSPNHSKSIKIKNSNRHKDDEINNSNNSNGNGSKIFIVEEPISFPQDNSENRESESLIGLNQRQKSKLIILDDNKLKKIKTIKQKSIKNYKLKKYKKQKSERELIKFDNINDSLSDDELKIISVGEVFSIDPDNSFKINWNTLCFILILFSMIISPINLAFNYHETNFFYIAEIIIDLIFFIDIILTFFTAYHIEEKLVTKVKLIIISYIKSSLIIDLFSIFPSTILISLPIENVKINHNNYEKIYFYNYIKWLRLLRIIKIGRISTNFFSKNTHKFFSSSSFKLLLSFFILVYFSSCIWCFIGNAHKFLNFEVTWINRYNMTEKEDYEIFVVSVYFILTTMFTIGYGDINPSNFPERIFTLLLLLVGSLTWSFVLTSLSYFFSLKMEKEVELEKKTKILEEIRKEHNLPKELFERFKKYLFFEVNKYNKDQIVLIDSLPNNLRNSLYLSMYSTQVSSLQFFKNQSYEFIINVLPKLKYTRYLKNEYVTNIGNVIEGVYMVHKGTLGIYLSSLYEHYEIGRIYSHNHIGDILMFSDDQSPYDIKVKTKIADMLILMKSDFANLYLNFNDAVEGILKKSNESYTEMENKKNSAFEYHRNNGTCKGFRYIPNHEDEETQNKIVENFIDQNFSDDENNLIDNKITSKFYYKPTIIEETNNADDSCKIIQQNSNYKLHLISIADNSISSSSPINLLRPFTQCDPSLLQIKNKLSHQTLNKNELTDSINLLKNINSNSNIISSPNKIDIMNSKINKYTMGKRKSILEPNLLSYKSNSNINFLNTLNNKIENHAIINKNKDIMGEYLKDVLLMEKDNYREEDKNFKSIMSKLDKLETNLKKNLSKKISN